MTMALLASFKCWNPGFDSSDVGASVVWKTASASIFESASVAAIEPTPSRADLPEKIAKASHPKNDGRRIVASLTTGTKGHYLAQASDLLKSLAARCKASLENVVVATPLSDQLAPPNVF